MQGDRLVSSLISIGPFTSKPNLAGLALAVPNVLVQIFPGSGSIVNTGSQVASALSDVDGIARINFSQFSFPTMWFVYKATYPAGTYDPDLHDLS